MKTYEQVLRGAAGLFAASRSVTRESFAKYVGALNLEENYPGIQGIGFSQLVEPDRKEHHTEGMRRMGFPDYTIRPEGPRPVYTSIIYLEPFAGANLRAFGYDMYSEPVRREAMDRARMTGKPAASSKVTLVQESGAERQAGFLLYLPVYHADAPSGTQSERQNNLLGWVYAPFRMNDLLSGISNTEQKEIDLVIYDGELISPAARLFASGGGNPDQLPHDFRIYSTVAIAQHTWTIAATATSSMVQGADRQRPLLVLQGGICISILLTLLTWVFLDDRTQTLRVARQALALALYDPLTRLPNRKLIEDRLRRALLSAQRRNTKVALMFIDLDKFKPVNDTFGHATGDLLLQAVAERLLSCVRASDTVSRLGGDEFVVLLAEVNETDGVRAAAGKMVAALNREFIIGGHDLRISCSIGIAVYPDHGRDDQALLKNADAAMYAAKKEGRNTYRLHDDATPAEA